MAHGVYKLQKIKQDQAEFNLSECDNDRLEFLRQYRAFFSKLDQRLS